MLLLNKEQRALDPVVSAVGELFLLDPPTRLFSSVMVPDWAVTAVTSDTFDTSDTPVEGLLLRALGMKNFRCNR